MAGLTKDGVEIVIKDKDWEGFYKAANAKIYKEYNGGSTETEGKEVREEINKVVKMGRTTGYTRDLAIWQLWLDDKIDDPCANSYEDKNP